MKAVLCAVVFALAVGLVGCDSGGTPPPESNGPPPQDSKAGPGPEVKKGGRIPAGPGKK